MKDRKKAALMAIFLGWAGGHKFYLGDTGSGIFYIMLSVFSVSMRFPIGAILGWIDAFALLTMSDERFDKKYNSNRRVKRSSSRQTRRSNRNPYKSDRRSQTRNRYDEHGRPKKDKPSKNPYQQNQRDRKRKVIKDNPFKTSGLKRLKDFELDLAEVDLQRALELSPDDIDIHFALGQLFSLNENKSKSFYHLAKAVELGFSDLQKIKTTDELAYLRIQAEFEEFEESGFRYVPDGKASNREVKQEASTSKEAPKNDLLQDDLLLSQLNKLAELRKKGLLSEKEFEEEKIKLTRR